jgi:hypothetical protein
MRRTLLACVLALPFLATAAKAAQFIVVEARGINMKVGALIDPTKPLVLTQGQHLTLISDSGKTIKLDGPYQKAPVAEQGIQLAAAFSGLATEKNARLGEIGTTRGVAPMVHLPNAWLLDATRSGTVCLQEGHDPVLWRPTTSGALPVVIQPADRSWKIETKWADGSDRLSVRKDLGMHGDASYFVAINGVENAIAIDTVPAALSSDSMRAAWMIEKGCAPQAQALMQTAAK